MPWKRLLVITPILIALLYMAKGAYTIIKWQAYIWFPSYISSQLNHREEVSDKQKHVIFIMVDHYEPGKGEQGVRINESWLEKFRLTADKHFDSFGNRFRYTWFYPYEHRNEEVLRSLSEMAFKGYGEVELHWHHPPATSTEFPKMLDEALQWFRKYGAFVPCEANPAVHFAFIHGNWALDNSQPRCGVNNELQILLDHGCYADFTFSTIGTPSQPRKINSIYYVFDTPDPKSYDTGIDAEVGKRFDGQLMIFEGPIAFEFKSMGLEFGAVESYAIPTPKRINCWIDANIHVKGRPEWVFIKVYSHGVQSSNAILDRHFDLMLQSLEEICKRRLISLHYMSTREGYNVVKAAEEGKEGNPENYRDYRVSKPCNMVRMYR
ncbi:MAG: hypothetical protein NTX30_21620 [Deltaproteobacteria bacterium]|nr:hypothetical protein [Deltaproteobacteria bacterium]